MTMTVKHFPPVANHDSDAASASAIIESQRAQKLEEESRTLVSLCLSGIKSSGIAEA